MNLAGTIANQNTFQLGNAFSGAAGAKQLVGGGMAQVVLDNRMIELADKWQRDMGNPQLAGVASSLLQSYYQEFERGPEHFTGAMITRAMFEHRVLVPLFVTHTGLVLNARQSDTLKAMTELISVLHVPEQLPMGKPEFMFRYIRSTQMLARKGQITTKTGGVVENTFDVNFGLEKYVAGITVGDKEFLTDSDPYEIISIFDNKLTTLETTWGLTRIHLHALYAAAQPSLLQLMCLNNLTHQPRGDGIGRLMQLFFIEHLSCGAINRNGAMLETILRTFQQLIGDGKRNEFVAVTPHIVTIADNVNLQKVTLGLTAGEAVVYNVNKPGGLLGYQLFGEVRKQKGYVNDDVSEDKSVKGGDDPLQDAPALDGIPPVEIEMTTLPNGGKVYVIPVDGTPFTSVPDAQSCDAALKGRGVKRVFFTVGGVPNAFAQYAHSAFFNSVLPGQGGGSNMTPKNICEVSPSESYCWDYNTNRPQRITMAMLHQVVASARLFDPTFAYESWNAQFPEQMLGYFNEDELAELILTGPAERMASPQVIFETDPRHMWVDVPVNVNVSRSGEALGFASVYRDEDNDDDDDVDRYRCFVPRGVLGNGSTCSIFENEMVMAVGGMCGIVGSVDSLLELMTVIKVGLESVDRDAILALRDLDVTRLDFLEINGRSNAIPLLMNLLHTPCYFSDPQCLMQIVRVVNATRAYVSNSQQPEPSLVAFMAENESQLTKIVEMIMQAKMELKELLKAVYAGRVQYNYLMAADNCLLDLTDGEPENFAFYKAMHGIVMPSLTNKVLLPGRDVEDSTVNMQVFRADNPANPCPVLNMHMYRRETMFVGDDYVVPQNQQDNWIVVDVYSSRDDLCLVRPHFRARYDRLLTEYSLSDLAKMMALIHYWTIYDLDTLRNHMDRRYPSGLSYLVVRTTSFLGHDMVGLPIRGARMLVGNRITAIPVANWSVTEYKQTIEMGMVPMDLTSTGVSCSNVYLTEINGMGAEFDIKNPHCSLVFDSYNYFVPHGIYTYQKELPILSAYGRFDAEQNFTMPDANLPGGRVTLLPTSFFRSSPIWRYTEELVGNRSAEESSVNYMKVMLSESDLLNSVPTHIRVAAIDGLKVEDLMNQVHTPGSKQRTIFTPEFGVLFTDDYTIGASSSVLFANPNAPTVNQELQPRINSLGGLSPNSGLRNNADDPKFTQAFLRNIPVGSANLARSF